MYHFCTYFDRNYLWKGLALYRSLARHSGPFTLWILCLDAVTYDILSRMDLANVNLIALGELEREDHSLLESKTNRTVVEYYWTCTPSLIRYLLTSRHEVDLVVYLDADLFFFSNPKAVFDEFSSGSILIHRHRYVPEYEHLSAKSGIFNVGLLAFRRDESSLACLSWWHDRCIEFCSLAPDKGVCGDQAYLNDWPERFEGVVILENKGAGVAPWNVSIHDLNTRNGLIFVDSSPLVFYHFHRFRILHSWLYEPVDTKYNLGPWGKRLIYVPYVLALRQARKMICNIVPGFSYGYTRRSLRWHLGLLRRRKLMISFGSRVLY